MKFISPLALIFLAGCSQLQLEQAASFMKELDKAVAAQKSGASSSSSSNAYTPSQSSSTSSANSSSSTTSRASPSAYGNNSNTNSYSPSSSSSTNNYSSPSASSSSSNSSSNSRSVQSVPTAMGCVRVTRVKDRWAEMQNTCSFPIEVAWCYAGGDCKQGTWGASSLGTIRAGSTRSASTFVSQSNRFTLFVVACQGANTSPTETSATSYWCKP